MDETREEPKGLKEAREEEFASAKVILRDPDEIENEDSCQKMHDALKELIERDGIQHVLNHTALYLLLNAEKIVDSDEPMEKAAMMKIAERLLETIPYITIYREVSKMAAGAMDIGQISSRADLVASILSRSVGMPRTTN